MIHISVKKKKKKKITYLVPLYIFSESFQYMCPILNPVWMLHQVWAVAVLSLTPNKKQLSSKELLSI